VSNKYRPLTLRTQKIRLLTLRTRKNRLLALCTTKNRLLTLRTRKTRLLTLCIPKIRQQIVQILCSHVRSKTSETEYQKTHKERPSNEIQTTLNLLFKEEERGLYTQDFAKVGQFMQDINCACARRSFT
jgi:septum formation topological specificity factor MinE